MSLHGVVTVVVSTPSSKNMGLIIIWISVVHLALLVVYTVHAQNSLFTNNIC